MNLKRQKVSMREEQNIITNMITSTEYLKQTKHIIKSYLLKSSYTKAVAGWCLEYFDKVGQAPGRDIQDLYIRKRKDLEDEEEVDLVSEFLQNLSNDWEESQAHNVGYEVKNTIKYFKLRQLEHLKEQLEVAIIEGKEEQGESLVANFKKVEGVQTTEGVDLLRDYKLVEAAFNEKEEVLFRLHGDLGKVVGNLCRGDFLCVLAGPKRGKSFCLWHIGHRAALMGLKVVVLNFEMTKAQFTKRAWQSLQGIPKESKQIKIPYFEEDEDGAGYSVEYRTEKRDGVDISQIKDLQKKYRRQMRGGGLRIETFISGQSTFSDAVTRLENLEYYENFTPDVIIWDYPDIMKLDSHSQAQYRHSLDDLWKNIRGYGVTKNCLTVAASQVNSSAWDKDIKLSDADENKKKANHVTKMIAINSTEEEWDAGIVRMQMLATRENKKIIDQVCVLQCLDIGRFYINSKFRKKVIMEDD